MDNIGIEYYHGHAEANVLVEYSDMDYMDYELIDPYDVDTTRKRRLRGFGAAICSASALAVLILVVFLAFGD